MAARIADNINPQRFSKQSKREITKEEEDESIEDPIDEREIFGLLFWMISFFNILYLLNEFLSDLIRDINDPEHPMSLEELNVVQITNIDVRYLSSFSKSK